jgi:hypothetical protein
MARRRRARAPVRVSPSEAEDEAVELEQGRLAQKILEELVYERVKITVDLCELMAFEEDLAVSIDRALTSCAGSPEERSSLALEYLQRAWERLSDEVMVGFAEAEAQAWSPAAQD